VSSCNSKWNNTNRSERETKRGDMRTTYRLHTQELHGSHWLCASWSSWIIWWHSDRGTHWVSASQGSDAHPPRHNWSVKGGDKKAEHHESQAPCLSDPTWTSQQHLVIAWSFSHNESTSWDKRNRIEINHKGWTWGSRYSRSEWFLETKLKCTRKVQYRPN
jgi:hypothetical protein